MRALITGAGGFAGAYLIRHLLDVQPDLEIVGVVHHSLRREPAADPRVRLVSCDITDAAAVARLVEDTRPDRLYHLAGVSSGASLNRAAVFRVNVEGTRNVIQAARGIVPPNRILFAGTGYVYGACDPLRPAREDDPLPASGQGGVYAESKQQAEEAIRACAGAVIARAFNHTGPGQTAAFSVPAFASQVVQIERGNLSDLCVGNLDACRDFLDVRDVVRAYRLLVEDGVAGEAYNVCSGQSRMMSGVLNELCALARVPIPITSDPSRMRPADIPASVGDPSKLVGLTGWQPCVPFSETLHDLLEWWRGR